MADRNVEPEPRLERLAAAAARPLAELLDCPQDAGSLLAIHARTINFEGGEIVFRQHDEANGLYVVVSGDLVRRTERLRMHVTLGMARPGDLLELASVLGDGHHTYTLTAVNHGSLLLLPTEALRSTFQSFPPLRMRLLEELAREVSRAYVSCSMIRAVPTRRPARAV
jgi:CRP-like cAMP-binding protein